MSVFQSETAEAAAETYSRPQESVQSRQPVRPVPFSANRAGSAVRRTLRLFRSPEIHGSRVDTAGPHPRLYTVRCSIIFEARQLRARLQFQFNNSVHAMSN